MKIDSLNTAFWHEPFNWEAALTSTSIRPNQWETLKSFTESWADIMHGRNNTVETVQVSSNVHHRLPKDEVLMQLCRFFRASIHSHAAADALNIFNLIVARTAFVQDSKKTEKIDALKNEIEFNKIQIDNLYGFIEERRAELKEMGVESY